MNSHPSDRPQVEIKFIFTGAQIGKVVSAFHLGGEAPHRTVVFFDTLARELFRGNITRNGVKVILRARFVHGKERGKTTAKIRTRGKLDGNLQTDDSVGAKREFDFAFGRELLDSYSLDNEQDTEEITAVLAGQRSVKKLFNHLQQGLLEQVTGKDLPWADLCIFGPVFHIQAWEDISISGVKLAATLELWELATLLSRDGRQILELSMRTELEQRTTAVNRLLVLLKERGIEPETTTTKTQIVLEHFSPGRSAK